MGAITAAASFIPIKTNEELYLIGIPSIVIGILGSVSGETVVRLAIPTEIKPTYNVIVDSLIETLA